jgi:hypothetical protein
MTKENAWPQWLGEGAQVEPTQTTRIIGFGRTADDALTERPYKDRLGEELAVVWKPEVGHTVSPDHSLRVLRTATRSR